MSERPTQWLAPEHWGRPATWLPALAAHIRGRAADDPTVLAVDIRAPHALDLLAAACEHLSGGRHFAEVYAVTEAQEAQRIAASATPATAPTTPPDASADPAATLDALREIKALHDVLRDTHDAAVFASTPPPSLGDRPLVSVRIPTWRGHRVLCDRTLPSVLQGTYENVEVVVCSDGPDPEARAAVEEVARRDARVRYVELDDRPGYPEHPQNLWRVGGIAAVNHALDHCRGDVIAPLDHDDAFTHGHVAELVEVLHRSGADLAYGQALCELREGPWVINGSAPLVYGNVAHGAVMYTRRLAHLRLDADAWLLPEPGDWNCWRRMLACGATPAFLPRPVLVHFAERSSMGDAADTRRYEEASVEQALADARRSPDLAALLSVATAGRTPVAA